MSHLAITAVRPVRGYEVRLAFSDDRQGVVDFRPLIRAGLPLAFASLQDPALFSAFALAQGTLHWPGDLDPAPEYLYFHAFSNKPALQPLFADWGYLNQETKHA